jgi:hypothetical protein
MRERSPIDSFHQMDFDALTAAPYADDAQVRQVLEAFQHATLPRSAWNHRAHLTVALSFARALSAADALNAMRHAIRRYNEAVGIENTPQSGYHETITVFFMQVLQLHVTRHPAQTSLADDANLLVAEWGRHDLPLLYYSRERLFSDQARAEWMPPDGQALPIA